MSAASSLGPRRPRRTRQEPDGYVPPTTFSRLRLPSGCHRVVIGYPARGRHDANLCLAIERPDGRMVGIVRIYPGELQELAERALEVAETSKCRITHIGEFLCREITIVVWVQRFDDTGPVIFFLRRLPDGESASKPMRITPEEFPAFAHALRWLREEGT